jgi:hypothetical protein
MKRAQGKSNLDIIRDYVNGERPFVQVGYSDDLNNAKRKEGEQWEDSQGRKWVLKNGSKRRVPKKSVFVIEKRCKQCKCDVRWGNYLDDRVWPKTQLCYDCFTKNETQMKLDGTWEYFDNARDLRNERSVLLEYKKKFDETLKWCEDHDGKPLEFVNEDGSREEWQTGADITKIREDVTSDLKIINARLAELDGFIADMESKYESTKLQRANKSRV